MELTRSAAGVLVVIGVTAGAGATYYLAHTTPEPTAEARVEVPAASARPVPLATEAGAAKALRRAGTVGAPIPKASEPAVPDTAVPVNTSAKAAAAVVPESAPEARAPRVTEPEEPKAPLFAEFVIEPDTVFGVQFDGTVSSDTAAVEDAVAAYV